MNKLDTLFKHKNWFTNYNEITNKYEPYLSKRLALQYFASSEDFIYNGKTLKYKGKEGGVYKLTNYESKYFEELLEKIKIAKDVMHTHIEKIKIESNTKDLTIEKFIRLEDVILYIKANPKEDLIYNKINFLDYFKWQSEETFNNLQKIIDIK